MIVVQRLLILLSILAITGCSGIKLYYQDDLDYVDGLIRAHEYERALRFIVKKDKNSPSYSQLQKRRPLIIKKINQYEEQTLSQSKKLINAQKWSDAIELLEDAIEHLPNSKILTRELKKQKSERSEEFSFLKYQILLHEARSHKEGQELYKRLYKIDSSTSISPEVIQQSAENIARELLEWAAKYVDKKETIKARNTLKLAGEVNLKTRRSPEFRKLLRKIEKIEKGISKAIKKKREIELNRQIKAFNRLFDTKDLVAAQVALKQIEQRFGKTKATKKLRLKLDKTVSREIREHMQNGQIFYSREQIEYAINEWGNVLLLDPNNPQALENISRAVKVLEQLQEVRKKQKN